MSYRHNGRLYDDMGVLEVTETDPGSGIRHNGWALDAAGYSHIVFERETLSGIARHDGQLFHAGRLVVTAATPGQVGDYRHKGLRYNARGSLYVTSGTPDASDPIRDGWRRTKMGAAYINGPSFFADLRDLGDGEVDTTLVVGTGSATFTRATEATCRLSNGLLKKVASGVPRSHYLSDGTYAGFLAEGARTNLVLRSEEFDNASWTKSSVTVTANDTTAPDGTATADKLDAAGGTGSETVLQAFTLTANVAHSVAIFFKKGTSTSIAFGLEDNTAGAWRGWLQVDWSGAVPTTSTTDGTVNNIKYEEWDDGWYRMSFDTTTHASNTSYDVIIYPDRTGNNNDVYAWGAQLEQASFPSSYIPTTTAAVTRNADVLTYTFAGNASATAGSVYAEVTSQWTTAPSGLGAMVVSFSNGNARAMFRSGAVSTGISIHDGTNVASKTSLTDMSTGVRKRATAWGSALVATGDGAAVATGAFDGDIGSTAIGVGCDSSGAQQWFGTVKNVRIWQRQLPDAVLQSLTS